MSEIRWTAGKDEYTREEVGYMLETQRAMIYNDIKYLLIKQAKEAGLSGVLTKEGSEINSYLTHCREVEF